jgi:acetyl esterase/lipase
MWLIVGFNSCRMIEVKPLIEEPIIGYKDRYDESYGKDPLQRYDIHFPENTSGSLSEVLILLHGGSWSGGDKSFLPPSVEAFKKAKKNLTIVNANYRLTSTSGIRLAQQLDDIQMLVEHLRQNAHLYNITDASFVIGGMSAGGHLALNYAYLKDQNRAIKAVVGIVAPTDLSSESLREAGLEKSIQQLIGKTYAESPEEYRNASPFYVLQSNAPTTMLFYGGKDLLVPQEQGELMKAKLTLLQVRHQYFFYPEETHDLSPHLFVDKVLTLF